MAILRDHREAYSVFPMSPESDLSKALCLLDDYNLMQEEHVVSIAVGHMMALLGDLRILYEKRLG